MTQIKIYSTTWCAFCKAEKHWLDEQGVKYTDVNIETDQAAADEMMKLSGQMGVPFTVLTKDDGTKASMVGFDQSWLAKELALTA